MSTLREVYQLFKETFPTKTIGFSKFAELRPKHCVLAGASDTHAVCVCTIHQNVKLMMMGGNLSTVTVLRAQIICNPPQPACYLSTCCSCPGISGLKEHLRALMDDNLIDNVVYKQWVSPLRQSPNQLTISWTLSVISWKFSFPTHSSQGSNLLPK